MQKRNFFKQYAKQAQSKGAISLVFLLSGLSACSNVTSSSSPSNAQLPNTPQINTTPVELSATKGGLHLPQTAIRSGRLVRTVTVDHGAIVIEPAPRGQLPQVSRSHAEAVIADASTSLGSGVAKPIALAYGRIHISRALTKGLSNKFENQLVWVALIPPINGAFCVERPPFPNSPRAFWIIIVGANLKTPFALTYHSFGSGACGGRASGPSISTATEVISLPWEAIGQLLDPHQPGFVDWQITYTVPRCGTSFDSALSYTSSSRPTLEFTAIIPVYPPLSCTPERHITTSWGPESLPVAAVGHSPIGILGA